jgi:TPR repeat protein
VEWSTAAENGNPQAQYELGICFTKGEGVPKDLNKAIEWWTKSAKQEGQYALESQYELGQACAKGEGVSMDLKKAAEWWKKAAEKGHALSQYMLGKCYANGDGLLKDMVKAREWWEKSAEQECGYAMIEIGKCLANGEGVAKDKAKAMEWWEKASKQKAVIKQARDLLGTAYLNEAIFFKQRGDKKTAADRFFISANYGNAEAQYEIGQCYNIGDGTEKRRDEAARRWIEAARQKNVKAYSALGSYYNENPGVVSFQKKAYIYTLLAQRGGEDVGKKLDEYGKKINPWVDFYQKRSDLELRNDTLTHHLTKFFCLLKSVRKNTYMIHETKRIER